MTGLHDLDEMLRTLDPVRRPGEFVFVTVAEPIPGLDPAAMIHEPEGMSLVITRQQADEHGLRYDFVGAWLTLQVHSALDAVGLTAAVSGALAAAGLSCNMLAGAYHDHLLVAADRADEALALLRRLAADRS